MVGATGFEPADIALQVWLESLSLSARCLFTNYFGSVSKWQTPPDILAPMNAKITILKNIPVFTFAQLGEWNEEQIKARTAIRRPLIPGGFDYTPLLFLENRKGVHIFTGHYETKSVAAVVARQAKKCFCKTIHLHPIGLPKLNVETLPDEGPNAISSAAASSGPVQMGFPLTW
jgi:hypothetical protein